MLLLRSDAARSGAARGLALWGNLLAPSLLPFFAAAGWLTRLGLAARLGRRLQPFLGRSLGLSGSGCAVFVLGLTAGYPMGAGAAADAVRCGRLSRSEGERLLRFCDNTGPGFAAGALGAGIFGSARWGLLVWAVHALTAFLIGSLSRGERAPEAEPLPASDPAGAGALTASVRGAVEALLSIGGYVVFFSALLAVTGTFGFPEKAALAVSRLTGADPRAVLALLAGLLELSSGIGAMAGLPLSPASLALGAFLLSWGGLCVHFQAAAATASAELKLTGRLWGKLLHGVLSAVLMYGIGAAIL